MTSSCKRREFLAATAALGASTLSWNAWAQSKDPVRPVTVIDPFQAGNNSDYFLRAIAEEMAKILGQPFIVENKPGAGTRVANELVSRATPDGYTFLYAAAPFATAEALFEKVNYNRRDLQPVAMAVMAPLFLVVNAHAPFKTIQEMIAYGKSKLEGLTFGSPGAGSQPHLAAELLFRDAGVKGLIVPFRGDNMAYTELLASRLDATLTALSTALPHIQSGSLRVLGVASAERSQIYPEASTLREQGLSSVVASGWYGFMAPAATPGAIVDRLQAEAMRALADPEVKQKLLVQGLEARPGTAAEFGKFIDDETRKWSEVIRAAGLKGE